MSSTTTAGSSPTSLPSPKNSALSNVVQQVIAGVAVAIIVGVATYLLTIYHERKRIAEAPTLYVQEIDKLINNAVAEGEGNAVINAKAIVAARNSLAHSLSAIGSQLDGQIDLLALEVEMETLVPLPRLTEPPNAKSSMDKHAVYMQVLVLQKIWPAKRKQIEVELRKLLAELGLNS